MNNESFNKPQISPNGCLVGNSSGKNTSETIMNILNKTTLEEYKDLGTIEEFRDMKEKMEKIQKVLNTFEKTFDWGCNDSVHSAISHAIYGIVENKDYFLEEYYEFLETNFK